MRREAALLRVCAAFLRALIPALLLVSGCASSGSSPGSDGDLEDTEITTWCVGNPCDPDVPGGCPCTGSVCGCRVEDGENTDCACARAVEVPTGDVAFMDHDRYLVVQDGYPCRLRVYQLPEMTLLNAGNLPGEWALDRGCDYIMGASEIARVMFKGYKQIVVMELGEDHTWRIITEQEADPYSSFTLLPDGASTWIGETGTSEGDDSGDIRYLVHRSVPGWEELERVTLPQPGTIYLSRNGATAALVYNNPDPPTDGDYDESEVDVNSTETYTGTEPCERILYHVNLQTQAGTVARRFGCGGELRIGMDGEGDDYIVYGMKAMTTDVCYMGEYTVIYYTKPCLYQFDEASSSCSCYANAEAAGGDAHALNGDGSRMATYVLPWDNKAEVLLSDAVDSCPLVRQRYWISQSLLALPAVSLNAAGDVVVLGPDRGGNTFCLQDASTSLPLVVLFPFSDTATRK